MQLRKNHRHTGTNLRDETSGNESQKSCLKTAGIDLDELAGADRYCAAGLR